MQGLELLHTNLMPECFRKFLKCALTLGIFLELSLCFGESWY